MSDLRPLSAWDGAPGTLVLWRPSPETLAAVDAAPPSPIPPSHEQEQHLRAVRAAERDQAEMARLLVVTWDAPGQCDLRVMTHVITAHLRRHDTYRSRFHDAAGRIERRVIADPAALRFDAVTLGPATASEWQAAVAATPSPWQWDCFRFGIIQRTGSYTVFASIDHVHADSSLIAILMDEVEREYRALLDGAAPTRARPHASYLAYCAAQRARTAALTLTDPAVAAWRDLLLEHGGHLPRSPLPLGDVPDRSPAEHASLELLDAASLERFDAAGREAGVRGLGAVLACAALAERSLMGPHPYTVVTPTTTRKTAEEGRMSGWCMGVVPIHVAPSDAGFRDCAIAAQRCFDERRALAEIPIERVVDLTRHLTGMPPDGPGGVMVSYMDTSLPPFSPHLGRIWEAAGGRLFINPGQAGQVAYWFFRTPRGLSVTAGYPATATARSAVQSYLEALRGVCHDVCRDRA